MSILVISIRRERCVSSPHINIHIYNLKIYYAFVCTFVAKHDRLQVPKMDSNLLSNKKIIWTEAGILEDMHSEINTHLSCRWNIMKMKRRRRRRRKRRKKKQKKLGYGRSRGKYSYTNQEDVTYRF